MLPAVPPEARCIVILIVSVIAGIEVLRLLFFVRVVSA